MPLLLGLLVIVALAASGGFYLGTWLQRRQDTEALSDAVEKAVDDVRGLDLSAKDHGLVDLIVERIIHHAANPS